MSKRMSSRALRGLCVAGAVPVAWAVGCGLRAADGYDRFVQSKANMDKVVALRDSHTLVGLEKKHVCKAAFVAIAQTGALRAYMWEEKGYYRCWRPVPPAASSWACYRFEYGEK